MNENEVKTEIILKLHDLANEIENCCQPPNDEDFVIGSKDDSKVNLYGLFDTFAKKVAGAIRSTIGE